MGRPPTPVGSYGAIITMPTADGQFKARCRFRDHDGVTRLVQRIGKTKTGAQNNLKAAWTRPASCSVPVQPSFPCRDIGRVRLADIADALNRLPAAVFGTDPVLNAVAQVTAATSASASREH